MKRIIQIAWKNIWRSRVRSLVVIGAVIVGVWALILLMSLMRGMVYTYINSAIQKETSHIQIHHPKYSEDQEIKYTIPNLEQTIQIVDTSTNIKSYSERILLSGMLSTANGVRGVMIKGIKPELEKQVTNLDQFIMEGEYFVSKTKNPILLSESIASKIKAKIRSKVVVNFQKSDGELTAAAFKVVGIFKAGNPKVDELMAFAQFDDLSRLAELPANEFHELAIIVNDIEQVDLVQTNLIAKLPQAKVETYKEISPDLELFSSQLQLNMIIMTTIVMLALIFGIINTMLMAVLERVKELGMLMAIGMNKAKIFFMIMIETIIVACVGAPIGMAIGYFTVKGLHKKGIDLSNWSDGLEKFGMTNMLRPVLESDVYFFIGFAIIITAIIGSIYPSLKAIKLKPVEALRKI